ncbi:MAG: ribonuclease P protein component [Woeseiaceae bacterium]
MTTEKESASGRSPGHRFTRKSRLSDAAAFGRVFRDARRSRDPMFTVLARENGNREARLGLAISRKHCRLATGRNRLKRIVRESFRRHRSELHGLDLVVINQPGAKDADKRALFASLDRHWQRCRGAGGPAQGD